ncbi:MAG: nucleoside 2-deoxyribosyltransferase [Methylococcales bacterium]|nr:nucleoside 2-deoxyribosyltransferase [Methylococcales bacterium]
MKKIYLAGPDVFYPDSAQRRDHLIDCCQKYGFEGIYPGDNDIDPPIAETIRNANMKMIESCDYVIANLSSFRGFEPDSGTVFEVGYATALGKKVVGYSNDCRPMIERLLEYQGLDKNSKADKNGAFVENFGLSNNLMFGHTVTASSPMEAVKTLKGIMENA